MCTPVSPEELISRYIDEKSKFRSSDMSAKYNLYMPPKSLKLSTYRISNITEEEIWEISTAHIEPVKQKPVIARADLSASLVLSQGLNFDPNGVPHPRHADVVGWDDDTKNRAIALELSSNALVTLKP